MTDKAAADFYLTISGKTYPFFVVSQDGVKQWNDGLAPMLTPQFRTGAFGYEHIPPDIEVIESYETFNGGAGYEVAPADASRYNYSRGIDLSYEDRALLSLEQRVARDSRGNHFHGVDGTLVLYTTIYTAPSGFFSSSRGLFMWAGPYIYQFDISTATWVLRENAADDVPSFGSSRVAGDAVYDDSTATPYTSMAELDGVLYAARGDATRYKYSNDGVTWQEYAEGVDEAEQRFAVFTVRGNGTDTFGLWGVQDGVIKNTTDGRIDGVPWVGSDEVAHRSENVRSIITVDNEIYVFKKEGFTRYDGLISEVVYTSEYLADSNGRGAYLHDNGRIYVPYNNQLLEYDPYGDTTLLPVYPNRGMDSRELRGDVRWVSGDTNGLLIAIKNADGNVYILRGLLNSDGSRTWHPTLYLGTNDSVAGAVAGPGVMHATNPVLVYGYGTSARHVILPRNGMRPDQDGNCTFDDGLGVAYFPYTPFGAKTFPKFLNRCALLGDGISAGRYATVKYEVDRNGTETSLVEATSSGLTERNELDDVSFHFIRPVLYMQSFDSSSTPTVDAIALFATLNPRRKRMWSPVIQITDEWPAREGVNTDETPSASAIRKMLFGAVTKRVVLTDREGLTYRCRLLDIQPAGLQEHTQGGVERDASIYQLSLVEITALTTNETEAIYGEHPYGEGYVFGEDT